MKKKINWKKAFNTLDKLQRMWDEISPELRRKLFVGDSFHSFRKWKELNPKTIELIRTKVHYQKDVEKILRTLRKAGHDMAGLRKMNVDLHLTFKLDTRRRTQPVKLKRSIKILRDEIAGKICEMLFDEVDDYAAYDTKQEVKITRR